MDMPFVYLVKELQIINYEIYRIMKTESETLKSVVGFLVLEDCNRPATIGDYPFLKDIYLNGDGFKGGENVLKCHAVVSESLSESDGAVLEHLGISLIEFKPKVDAFFEVHVQPELEQWLDQMEEKKTTVLQNLLNYSENKINISDYSEASFSRLTHFRR